MNPGHLFGKDIVNSSFNEWGGTKGLGFLEEIWTKNLKSEM